MKNTLTKILALVITAFALLTLFLSSSVIFDMFDIRAKEGNYVLFIVWTNFIASIIYLISVFGLLNLKEWTYKILGSSVIILIIGIIGLQLHIDAGGLFEEKTVKAMYFRTSLTLIFTLLTYLRITKWND